MIKKIKKYIWYFYKPIKYNLKFKRAFKEYNKLAINTKALKHNEYKRLYDATLVTHIEPTYFLQDA